MLVFTLEHEDEVIQCFKAKRKLCNKTAVVFYRLIDLFCIFRQLFQYVSLILNDAISLGLNYKLFINQFHRIIFVVKISPYQKHSAKSP